MCLNYRFAVNVQDQTSSRPNTLSDDADDIQKQLDSEARDRFNLHVSYIFFDRKISPLSNGISKLNIFTRNEL